MGSTLARNPMRLPNSSVVLLAPIIAAQADDRSLAIDQLARRMADMLDALDCGLLLYAGDKVVLRNQCALVAMHSNQVKLADRGQPAFSLPDTVAAIEAELASARESGHRRMVSVDAHDQNMAVATVPLTPHSSVEQDMTLVVFGTHRVCELISDCVENMVHEVLECLLSAREPCEPNRALVTLMFTDIVDSTRKAEWLGDKAWQELLARHHGLVRSQLGAFRGREVDTAGDGFFATFDAPARAVRCASAIRDGARGIGLEIRAGLHTGECELVGDRVIGVAVHVAARVASIACGGQIMVSSTVKELVAGSGLMFSRGSLHSLRGLNERRRLFCLSDSTV